MRRLGPLTLALLLLVAACGDDDAVEPPAATTTLAPATTGPGAPATTTAPGPATTASPPPASSTTMPSTTVPTTMPSTTVPSTTVPTTVPPSSTTAVPPATTTTAPPTGPFLVDETAFFPDPLPGSNGAHGSGCVADTAAPLPDGVWFGYAEALVPGMITFDLACFWTGAEAVAAAAADGAEAFDFYIRNMNPATFAVPIAGSARVWSLDQFTIALTEIAPTAWPDPTSFLSCPGEFCSVWLYVNGGRATGIVEQYLP